MQDGSDLASRQLVASLLTGLESAVSESVIRDSPDAVFSHVQWMMSVQTAGVKLFCREQ